MMMMLLSPICRA